MIDLQMPDKDFDLMTISDNELFEAVKKEVVSVLKTFKQYKDIESSDIKLNEKYTNRRKAYGLDRQLYPHITLDIGVKSYLTYDSFNLFVNTFGIQLAEQKFNSELITDENLTNAFIKFMLLKFPNSNYSEKRNTYLKNAQTRRKIENDLLFF